METTGSVFSGEGGRTGEKVQGIRSINGRYKIDRGRLSMGKNTSDSMGNGEAKELLCMIHGHELRWGMRLGGGSAQRGIKGRKNGTTVIA